MESNFAFQLSWSKSGRLKVFIILYMYYISRVITRTRFLIQLDNFKYSIIENND